MWPTTRPRLSSWKNSSSRRSRSTACAVSTDLALEFDLAGAWRPHPQVSIRPERFGALLYHFGTRRLSFLKNTTQGHGYSYPFVMVTYVFLGEKPAIGGRKGQ